MMRRVHAVLAAALVAAAVPAGAQRDLSPTDVIDAFHAALHDGDRRKALEQLSADVTVFEQGRIERTRTEYARQHLGEDIGFASIMKRSVERRSVRIQGNVAWVMSVNRTTGRFKGRPVDFVTDETMVLTRTGSKWRIVHVHWSFDDKAIH